MTITARAYGKINWALNITGRRPNGYHELDMLMQSIALCDDMTFEEADDIALEVDGVPAMDAEGNLVVRAARALNAHAGTRRGARMTLTKRIPARAGLGGGSADCALTLRTLNALWGLGLSDAELLTIGVKLGADLPFCLTGGLCRVRGIGEIVEPLAHAPEIPLVLVTPGGGLSTVEVYGLWDRGFPPVKLDAARLTEAVVCRDLAAVDRLSANALAAPAIQLMPEIKRLMECLRDLGGKAVLMTGSGSTVVAAFDDAPAAACAAAQLPGAMCTHTRGR